ncbi:MAG TPA: M36 family metallopeptidase [Blastocatellia bacterium]|nr:M36 family metallopeptidase [Blastocatellia bacterium]
MPINFIPNDPLAVASLPSLQKAPRPNRPATRAGFNFTGAVAEGLFNPGTPGFLFWQCREAALLAVEVWEALNGNLTQWARATPNRRRLNLLQNNGTDLNAFYDGQSLSFFQNTTGNKTTFSGASTDVVAHEAGHAFLDTVRAELFTSPITEHGAIHEAFGDIIAILVGLSDRATRDALLAASPNLGTANFLEATAEDLSDGVRRALGPNHPAAAPRHALNNFRFQLPTTLPSSAPPSVLTREIHSFGRIFSGCFYDTVRNIFASFPQRNQATLLTAAQTAGRLLIAGIRQAPLATRFFQATGRAMVLADQTTNGGANREAIINAFSRHGIALGSTAMLAPRASLAGEAPKLTARAKGPMLSAATAKDIKKRIEASPSARLSFAAVKIGDEKLVEATHQREVPLQSLSKSLKGVVAIAPEPILVGAEGSRAAIVSALPDASTTADEVHAFVETLMEHNRIAFDGARRGAVATTKVGEMPTHTITTRGGKKVLTRIRFLCG